MNETIQSEDSAIQYEEARNPIATKKMKIIFTSSNRSENKKRTYNRNKPHSLVPSSRKRRLILISEDL